MGVKHKEIGMSNQQIPGKDQLQEAAPSNRILLQLQPLVANDMAVIPVEPTDLPTAGIQRLLDLMHKAKPGERGLQPLLLNRF